MYELTYVISCGPKLLHPSKVRIFELSICSWHLAMQRVLGGHHIYSEL